MTKILQHSLPYDFRQPRPLPGIAPLAREDWLWQDEAYAEQMAERARLLATKRADVTALAPGAEAAADELLQLVLADLRSRPGFKVAENEVACPDGRSVPIDEQDPMGCLGLLLQQDFCLLQKQGDEHVLTGAVLCFPSHWRLREKFLRPLLAIHVPVPNYDANIGKRVQRLFDGIQPDRPLWRFNVLWSETPDLYTPESRPSEQPYLTEDQGSYLRSERQVLLRLPKTRAVVFSIHTFMLDKATAQAL